MKFCCPLCDAVSSVSPKHPVCPECGAQPCEWPRCDGFAEGGERFCEQCRDEANIASEREHERAHAAGRL